jgi:hypothetical protein
MNTSILDTAIAGLLSAIALHFRQSEVLDSAVTST